MVWEIENYMPLEEFEEWLAWFKIKDEAQKKQLDRMKQERQSTPKRPRSRMRH